VLVRLCIILSIIAAADITLDNGIRIHPQADEAPSFTLVLGYRAGIRNETHSFTGMATVVSRYLQSTAAARSLVLAAYGAGGSVEFVDEPDRTAVRVSVPPWAAPMVLNAAASFFADAPDKDRDLVERARSTAIANAGDGPSDFKANVENEVRIALLGSHPYTHPSGGWKTDLEQVSTDDVIRFFNENYGTDRAFVLMSSPLPNDVRQSLSAVKTRRSRRLPDFTGRVLNAERTLHFAPDGSTGSVIFAAPVPGVFYRGWYATLVLDRIVRRTLHQKPVTALPLTVDPYYWSVQVAVPAGQLADSVEENLLQDIDRLQFTRTKPEDLQAARQDAASYLDSPNVREWFASEDLESRRQEGLQWVESFTVDDIRATVRDTIAANRVVASWSAKPKQNTVQVESISAASSAIAAKAELELRPLNAIPAPVFPPHPQPAKIYSTPERLGSGVWLAASSISAVFVSGADSSGLPEGVQRSGSNGALWVFNGTADANTVRAFQKYRADRMLILSPPGTTEAARSLWNTFKSNDRDATVVALQGKVANIDLPALIVLKLMLDRKLIESGWWHDAALRIDATTGATLEIDAPATIRTQVTQWMKNIAAVPVPEADFVWGREAAINHLNDILPDVQILLWQRVRDYILPDLETISLAHVQDVAKLYF
jgi:hypothetical protein